MKVKLTYNVIPTIPEKVSALRELAYNVWFSWHPEVIRLFHRMDSNLWEETNHNPILMLGRIPQSRILELALDAGFLSQLDRIHQEFKRYMSQVASYAYNLEKPADFKIAYLSMEYGLTECLPFYSGGLGVLSGDHLKSASDLNIPIVAIGLLYQQGYFRQYLSNDGWQQETYPMNDLHNMPIQLVKNEDGIPVTIVLNVKGRDIHIRVWKVQVGRINLYLLDSNNRNNSVSDRDITAQLYGGNREIRLLQEIILGIGGVRILKELGIDCSVFHMNEGHSAFAALERCRYLITNEHCSFVEAKEAIYSSNVFTTHTPVPAGIDTFDPRLIEEYFTDYVKELGITLSDLFALARQDPNNQNEPFSMAVLAIKMSSFINGVSKLHSNVSKKMWRDVWPQLPETDVPIEGLTNGVHIPSWISQDMADLYDRYLGPNWTEEPDSRKVWVAVGQIPDSELWRTHERRRERMIGFLRRRLETQLTRRGASTTEKSLARDVLNPEALTIGFARRFATYKRGYLLFKDIERLKKLLSSKDRPLQFIFAGKAHPQDDTGKEVIRKIVHTIQETPFRHSMVFIEDYDMNIARYMVEGVDVWLNTPRRPLEACGTSGMKATANAVLNFSILDGWWDEGYNSECGWSIGKGEDYTDMEYQDQVESQAIYNILENEIIPQFYERGRDNLPRAWIAKMKNNLKQLCPVFNSNRMLEEYMDFGYFPAATNWKLLSKNNFFGAKELSQWRTKIHSNWNDIKILDVEIISSTNAVVGDELKVSVTIKLGNVTPDEVSVDLYYGKMDSKANFITNNTIKMGCESSEGSGIYKYFGSIKCISTGRYGLTIRILPYHLNLSNPLSLGLVVWS